MGFSGRVSPEIINNVSSTEIVGGLTKNKGVFDIIKAAQLLKHENIYFSFVGGGPVNEFKILVLN